MPHTSRIRWITYLTVSAWLLIVPAASAYVDPGSTSLVFAWVVGGIAALSMGVKTYWRRLRSLFVRGQESDEQPPVGRPSD